MHKSNTMPDAIIPACNLVRAALDLIEPHVKPGISTGELNDIIHNFIIDSGAVPAPLLVGFPQAVCISLNNVICHGIPSYTDIITQEDILNIDVSLKFEGYFGDASRMYHGGKPSKDAIKLINITHNALKNALKVCYPGNRIGDIGAAICETVEPFGYSIVRNYTGHGISTSLHEMPIVRHYGQRGTGPRIEPGMCFTIEPMINIGGHQSRVLDDGWTVVTKDMSLSAQWENQIYITESEPIVLAS